MNRMRQDEQDEGDCFSRNLVAGSDGGSSMLFTSWKLMPRCVDECGVRFQLAVLKS